MATEKQIKEFKEKVEEHRKLVIMAMEGIIAMLRRRAFEHDQSKLSEPELSIMAELQPELEKTKYGSDEYFDTLERMKLALDSHYELNSHHPQHYLTGISGMDILDIIEMLIDWYVQSLTSKGGNFQNSVGIGRSRFDIGDQLFFILNNSRKVLDNAVGRTNAAE